ncbi:hypothetical protein V5799_002888 [Amblyomma americanum]|uniref:Uncharacterized protein n=1 Tax=Amblyomma americanum TaxID=6943 RepID=A0AAQ4DAI9_AMBAM
MRASGGGRRRLLVLWLLAFTLSAVGEQRPGSKGHRHHGSSPQRDRRGVRWHKLLEPGPSEDAAYGPDADDEEQDNEDVYATLSPRIEHAYQEDWMLDKVLSHIQSQDAGGSDERGPLLPAHASHHRWVPRVFIEDSAGAKSGTGSGDAPDSIDGAGSATGSLTTSSTTTSTIKETSKTQAATTVEENDDFGQCPAQDARKKKEGLMEVLFGTKLASHLTTVTTKTTRLTKATTTASTVKKITLPAIKVTKQATTKVTTPRTKHTAKETAKGTKKTVAPPRRKPPPPVQVPPSSDSGSFVMSRFAHVSRESAYMEHMEPMVAFSCRVHLWIIGVLCAMLLLMTLAYCASSKPRTEPVPPPRPPEPPSIPVSPPMSPTIRRPPTEVWEDDLYDVSEIAKMQSRPSVSQVHPTRFLREDLD